MPATYDTVLYPTTVSPRTHPDRLATLGRLFGLAPAPVEQCRVLEVGCGDASNLIPMADALPASTFVGFDLAARPIAQGRARAKALGLENLTLHALDLRDVPGDWGAFDYIIAHGLYAWVPSGVRDALMALVKRHLAPQGVAFVSYNLYPGGFQFRMLREMMLFHTREIDEPERRASQARALLDLLQIAQADDTAYARLLDEKIDLFSRVPDEYLAHDILAEVYEPTYFLDFVEHAQRHDVQYLADADYFSMHARKLPEAARERIQALERTPLLLEQYLDFMRGRSFRRSLLCHAEAAVQRVPRAEDMAAFHFAAPVEEGRAEGVEAVPFKSYRDTSIQTGHPMVQAVCRHLGGQWPRRVPYEELQAVAQQHEEPDAADALLGDLLLALYQDGFVEAHVYAPPLTLEPGSHPEASRAARHQAATADVVPNLNHTPVELTPDDRRLLPLLDGSHDRQALQDAAALSAEALDATLTRLARQGLLIA